ncbi:CybS-domain-containing protein [Tricharina praecox]|uniref:CybS-domain-containing protein n=1 Tax=Tricharina praecox TaxID=43433 RepID=UPI00221F5CE1|nr:CybS-domain-containing protein [Tricharina praecox]KAI5854603.1 CybS-domain-containing protein [Tricharina praecox]
MSLFRTAAPRFISKPLLAGPRVATFHTSKKLQILPVGPQVIDGTINDPTPIPETSPSHGSYHWSFERLVSLGLVPLTIAPFAAGSMHPIADAVLGATIVMHSHIGFQSCVIDYFPKRKYPKSLKTAKWTLNAATVLVLYGLYEFETNDVGITEGVKKIWTA